MNENFESSKKYRDNLAEDLKETRKDNPEKAERILEQEKKTIRYQDAKEDKINEQRGIESIDNDLVNEILEKAMQEALNYEGCKSISITAEERERVNEEPFLKVLEAKLSAGQPVDHELKKYSWRTQGLVKIYLEAKDHERAKEAAKLSTTDSCLDVIKYEVDNNISVDQELREKVLKETKVNLEKHLVVQFDKLEKRNELFVELVKAGDYSKEEMDEVEKVNSLFLEKGTRGSTRPESYSSVYLSIAKLKQQLGQPIQDIVDIVEYLVENGYTNEGYQRFAARKLSQFHSQNGAFDKAIAAIEKISLTSYSEFSGKTIPSSKVDALLDVAEEKLKQKALEEGDIKNIEETIDSYDSIDDARIDPVSLIRQRIRLIEIKKDNNLDVTEDLKEAKENIGTIRTDVHNDKENKKAVLYAELAKAAL